MSPFRVQQIPLFKKKKKNFITIPQHFDNKFRHQPIAAKKKKKPTTRSTMTHNKLLVKILSFVVPYGLFDKLLISIGMPST